MSWHRRVWLPGHGSLAPHSYESKRAAFREYLADCCLGAGVVLHWCGSDAPTEELNALFSSAGIRSSVIVLEGSDWPERLAPASVAGLGEIMNGGRALGVRLIAVFDHVPRSGDVWRRFESVSRLDTLPDFRKAGLA